MNKYIILIGLYCCCMTSCIKDEALNKECDIESVWIEGKEYEQYFYQPTEMKKEVSSTEESIVFFVRSLTSLKSQIPLNFKITDGATIEPDNGSMQDFTKGPVTYTVTSQDGQWKRMYQVTFREASLPIQKFRFEHVEVYKEPTIMGNTNEMHVFYEQTDMGKQNYCWATGNQGSSILKEGGEPESFPVYSTPDGKEGKGVCLNTQSNGSMGVMMKKPIASGCLFLGKFKVEHVLTDALKATQFGVANSKEPVRITGWYKYKPGEKYTDKDMNEIPGRTDEACIYAVFYRNTDEAGKPYVLDGHAVEELDKIILNPQVYKTAFVSSLPATNTWTQWEMTFEGKEVPDDILSAQGCNLALVFSSSKYGAEFAGAIGSTLHIDEVEVSYEK